MGWVENFVLLFATTNAMKAAIVSLAMTKNADAALKRAIAFRAVLITTVVCILFALAGAAILAGLKITVEALLIAGGAILFLSLIHISEPTRPAPLSRMPSSA